jgi:hypothetical protein
VVAEHDAVRRGVPSWVASVGGGAPAATRGTRACGGIRAVRRRPTCHGGDPAVVWWREQGVAVVWWREQGVAVACRKGVRGVRFW